MPLWTSYPSFNEIIQELPIDGKPRDTYSIPDVYGKAIQFYLALENSYNQLNYKTEEVALWRGLIALLALKDYRDLPLDWKSVNLTDKNTFCNALQYTPVGYSAFSQNQAAQWNGSLFYALTWEKEEEEDLLIYSPATLVYPVADWHSILSKIPDVPCFNYTAKRFDDPADVLEVPEKKIVYYWLQGMDQKLSALVSNEVLATIRRHLDRYMDDLNVSLSQWEVSSMEPIKISKNGGMEGSIGNLDCTVGVTLKFGEKCIPAKRFFSEQLCCFETKEPSPFQNCSDSQNYKIRNKANWYALLPFAPSLRECTPQLAGGVDMTWIDRDDGPYIRVTMTMPSGMDAGMDLVKEYKVLDGGTEQEALPLEGPVLLKDAAVKCPSTSGELPLIAIWPGVICGAWKKYYVLIDDPYAIDTTLEVCGEGSESGENKYAIKVSYLPDAIPIERVRSGQRLSAGMVTPKISRVRQADAAQISADVAVDFGTSSTRVFAKIQGIDKKTEIKITNDNAFIVTGGSNKGVQNTLRGNFVPSEPSLEKLDHDRNPDIGKGLFSIYKRSSQKILNQAQPILDGLIYRAEVDENVENFKCFMPDLKWSVQYNETYLAAFIKQLCLHVMGYLHRNYHVTNITWYYSMPESLIKGSKETIKEIWEDQVQKYLESVSGSIKNHVPEFYMSESEAASRYFLFDEVGLANTDKGFLVVDIGGGSIDIALWQKDGQMKVMKWHTSVGVAGRRMFTRWITKHLKNLSSRATDSRLVGMTEAVLSNTMSDEVRTALVERILGLFAGDLKDEYKKEIQQHSSGWGTDLCAQVNLGVSLLMFALGCQVGQMISSKGLSIPGGEGSFVIAVGGTGSKILDWALCGDEIRESFFRAGTKFAKGCIPSKIEFQPSNDAKGEVARGLLETAVTVPDKPETNVEGTELDYHKAVKEFERTYNDQFGSGTDSRNLPKLKISKSHIANELKKYEGNRGDIVKVFMECLYECICMDYKGNPGTAPDSDGKEDK